MTENSWTETLAEGRRTWKKEVMPENWTEVLAEGRRLLGLQRAAMFATRVPIDPDDEYRLDPAATLAQWNEWATFYGDPLLDAAEEAEQLRAENAQMKEALKVRGRIYPEPRDYEAPDDRAAIRARGENDETP